MLSALGLGLKYRFPFLAGGIPLVFDFDDEYYRTSNSKTTFESAISHNSTTATNGTMVDSDGILKWRPHNLALNSAAPATQSITVISGADYTVECTGVSIAVSGAGTGTVTEGNPVTITASTTTLTLTVTGSTGTMWCYRSDLGGMVNNPDRGDSYVPTTDSSRYLPRRGHHVYNGSTWVNEGLLVESEARTNLITQSNAFTTTWTDSNATPASAAATGPDGETSMWNLVDDGGTGTGEVYLDFAATVAVDTTYTFSAYVKANDLSWCALGTENFTTPGNVETYFDLSTGAVGTEGTGHTANISDEGGGIYRVSITFTTDSSDTSGNVRIYVADADTDNTVDLDGTSSIYVYGAQIEAGSTPSSYIPTSGATATRGAETLTVDAADLPWPTPKVIGPELVTNGTFDTDSDWVKQTGWTISGGVASFSGGGGKGILQNIGIVTGTVYEITFDITSISSGGLRILCGFDNESQIFNSTGTHTAILTGGSNSFVYVQSVSATVATIDNVSVREIDPLAVSIQMDGRVTYADTDDIFEANPWWWFNDSQNRIISYLSTLSADTGQVWFLQEQANVSDSVSSASDSYSPGIFVPFNIASRHGSTFINGAVDGTALTADTTPTSLPDLSTTDLNLAYDYMGTIRTFRMWNKDLGDTGIAEASEGEPSSYLIWDANADTYISKVYD